MTEAKHTPGPWLPARMTTKLLNIVQVGETYRCSVVGDDDGAIVATVHGRTEKECGANARLISMAPEMSEVLAEGRRAIGDHYAPSDCYATGPLTGDPIRDLVQCPACSFIGMYEAFLAKTGAA